MRPNLEGTEPDIEPFGAIISDVDGTLAARECPIDASIADLLVSTVECGWRVIFLTGQSLENMEPRVIPALRAAMELRSSLSACFTLLTCEGASEWIFDSATCISIPRGLEIAAITKEDQQRILALLSGHLTSFLPPTGRILTEPRWFEDAMCVAKIEVSQVERLVIANQLQALFRAHGFTSLRIGLGGTYSIIVTHESINKGTALKRIVDDMGRDKIAVYLADEFDESGNDAGALLIQDLACFDFSRKDPHTNGGPEAVARWLHRLIAISLGPGSTVESLRNQLPGPKRRIS